MLLRSAENRVKKKHDHCYQNVRFCVTYAHLSSAYYVSVSVILYLCLSLSLYLSSSRFFLPRLFLSVCLSLPVSCGLSWFLCCVFLRPFLCLPLSPYIYRFLSVSLSFWLSASLTYKDGNRKKTLTVVSD